MVFSVIILFPLALCSSPLLSLLPHVYNHMFCPVYTLRFRKFFFFFSFLCKASSKVPLGERHVMLTAHVFNDRRVLKSDSAHLSSLRRCKGSTSLTRLPCGIDHLMILKYSHLHNNKKPHRGVVCSILITLQRLYGVSWALRVSRGTDLG